LNLDWIRTVNHFNILDPDWIWTELMEKKCNISLVKRLHFSNILDFIWIWTLHLKKIVVGLGLKLKKSGLDLGRKISQSAHLCKVALEPNYSPIPTIGNFN